MTETDFLMTGWFPSSRKRANECRRYTTSVGCDVLITVYCVHKYGREMYGWCILLDPDTRETMFSDRLFDTPDDAKYDVWERLC